MVALEIAYNQELLVARDLSFKAKITAKLLPVLQSPYCRHN
jgi:hypothetical protein